MSPSQPLIVIDGHTDVAPTADGYDFPIEDARAASVGVAVVAVRGGKVPAGSPPGTGLAELEATWAGVDRALARNSGTARRAASPEEVLDNAAAGVLSIVPALQNAHPLEDLEALAAWLDRGIAIVDFGFIGDNRWVRSSRPYPSASVDTGGPDIGPRTGEAIDLLNERGVVIDTAQVSAAARTRIIERSVAPVIASHNGLRATVGEADRTITDDEVRQLADKGGLVQIVAFDGYLTPRGSHPRVVEEIRELRERFGLPGYTGSQDYYAVLDPETADWDEQKFDDYFREYHAKVRYDWPRSDVEKLVDAIDHVIDLVGIDHVGIASDFHHGGGITGWLGYADTPRVTEALRRRHDEDEVAKIWVGICSGSGARPGRWPAAEPRATPQGRHPAWSSKVVGDLPIGHRSALPYILRR